MPKKTGAGDRPQEYDSRTGRYGSGRNASNKKRSDDYGLVWDSNYSSAEPVKLLSKTEYRLYCQAVDNNQYGAIEILADDLRAVTIYLDDGSVVVIKDNNDNRWLRPIYVKRFKTVDAMNDYYRKKERTKW